MAAHPENHDTAVPNARREWQFDLPTASRLGLLKTAPTPVGYDPAIIPVGRPRQPSVAATTSPDFASTRSKSK